MNEDYIIVEKCYMNLYQLQEPNLSAAFDENIGGDLPGKENRFILINERFKRSNLISH